jgi:peptidoglycan/LPS O-acetylase OafA/YrhL
MTSRADHTTYLATRHFGSLDGLRFLCISAVIWHHLGTWKPMADAVPLAARGHVGVDFFFVLSGFLITTLLLREESMHGSFSIRAFYWRRFLRIVPVFYFVITIAALYAFVVQGRWDQVSILPYYYLFLSNFLDVTDIPFLSVTWSLAMEEQFYLIWPALLMLVPRVAILPVLVGLIAINVVSAIGAFGLIGIHAIEVGPLRFAIEAVTYAPLLMAAALALLLHDPAGFSWLRPLLAFRGAPILWFGLLLISLGATGGPLEGWRNLLVHSLMCTMLGSLVVRETHALAPILTLRPIERIGQISYGIYLYHLIALVVMSRIMEALNLDGAWLLGLGYYAIAIVMAEISFRTLEAWALRYRSRGWGRAGGLVRG